ncbi:hypothetical protein CLV47_101380 [Antricoccus suffuscus]|uniref:Uncharacterized protein n=1 Tax=Antricoccus suffuscus TaxID=1629062 RepID=A0A2T1A6L7_9ACTN|nr:hypothetical protein [Antricoccus suffuscus]PRZ44255.1 hypothetical protein CLV47_101380 [Antricoccus suffuscus]
MTQSPYGGQSPYQNQGGYQDQPPATKNKLPVVLAGLIAVVGLAIAVVIIVVGRSGSGDNQAAGDGGQSGTSTQSAQSDASKTSDSKGTKSDKSSGAGDTVTKSELPKGFPVPDGLDISTYSTGGEVSGLATLTDPEAAYNFWMSELPKAGYEISDKTKTGSGESLIGQITFSGNGYGSSTISIVGTTAAIGLKPKTD